VPEYIDRVVTLNKEHQPLARAGVAWLIAEARRRYAEKTAWPDAQTVTFDDENPLGGEPEVSAK